MNQKLTFNTQMRKINTANTKNPETHSLSKTNQVNTNRNNMNMTSNIASTLNKRNKDDFFVFSNKKEYFGFDNERLKEEILKLKKENNKKIKEIDLLKAEIKVHSQESKKQMKVIEDILLSSGKSFDEVTSIFDGSKVENIIINANSVIKLREVYVINFLKSQVGQLKGILHDKEEEIGKLTENIKVTKLIQLENDLKAVKSENEMLKNELLRKVGVIEEKDVFLKDNQQEHVLLYKKYIKKEIEYEKVVNSLLKVEEERKVLLEENKKITENSNRIKLNMINMKADVKYKSEVGLSEKMVDDEKEVYEKEKESLNKKVNELKKENSRLKVDMK